MQSANWKRQIECEVPWTRQGRVSLSWEVEGIVARKILGILGTLGIVARNLGEFARFQGCPRLPNGSLGNCGGRISDCGLWKKESVWRGGSSEKNGARCAKNMIVLSALQNSRGFCMVFKIIMVSVLSALRNARGFLMFRCATWSEADECLARNGRSSEIMAYLSKMPKNSFREAIT
jgi:hypothetical protein